MATKKKDEPVVDTPAPVEPTEDRRAPDADGAVEVAFVEGALPEEDRRQPAEPVHKGVTFPIS